MNGKRPTRRQALENCISRGLLLAGTPMAATNLLAYWQSAESDAPQAARKATPGDVLGPFYKKGAPSQATLRAAGDAGIPLRITGKVLNTAGAKVPGARINIWHADHDGIYDLQGYRFRSTLAIEDADNYSVDTIMPGHYDDRPAQHVHYLITAPGHKSLITQAYFATDSFFDGDPDKNMRKRNIVSSRELIRPVTLFEKPGAAHASITFDIILAKA